MLGARYILIYACGDVRYVDRLHDLHAIETAKSTPDVVRVTEDDGRLVWQAEAE